MNGETAICRVVAVAVLHKTGGLMEDAMIRAVQLVVSAAAVAVVAGAATPAAACNPHITMSQVDQALTSSRLKGSKLADANALRDYMAEAVQKNDQRRAHHLETQVMQLMGYVEDRPVSRSAGCARVWKKM